MSTSTIKATWRGPRRHFPTLGATVEDGDTLMIPRALADEDRRWETARKATTPASSKPADDAGDTEEDS